MGVKTALAAITLTNTEIAAAQAYGEDGVGMLESAGVDAAELSHKVSTIIAAIPAGANATALAAVVTSLT